MPLVSKLKWSCILLLQLVITLTLAARDPQVYVIQDDQQVLRNLGHQPALSKQQQVINIHQRTNWNNQRLALRAPSQLNDQDQRVQSSFDAQNKRIGKQLFYSDQPTAYYSSFKYLGHHGPNFNSNQPRASHFVSSEHYSGPLLNSGAVKGRSNSNSLARRQHQPKGVKTAAGGSKGYLPETRKFQSDISQVSRRSQGSRKNLVCYYGSWAVYRPDAGKFPVENIDPFLCTHIIYGFTGLSYDNLIKPLDPWNDLEDNYGKGAMKRFTGLKRQNPDLKALVAIGGWNEGSIKYSKMASEPEARARFVESVVDFLKKYNFDGLDLDWEYPGSRGGASYDKQNFVKLIRELHDAFKPHGFLLSAAVSAGKATMDSAYDIPQVSRYLDLINLMAYDYHGGWETKTGMNAPLFSSPKHDLSREDQTLNVNWSVNYWLQNGASPEKIMLGVGSYGRSFTLDKSNQNGINAPASQKGQAGPYTREPGSLGYNEICESFKRQPQAWTIVRDSDYLAPYAYNDRQWVGYDDVESLTLKAQFAKSMGLGGMMMWSIETDDFLGRCHDGQKYPLLNAMRNVMDSREPGISITKPPSIGQSSSSTTTTTMRPIVVKPTTSPNGNNWNRPRPTTPRPPISTTPGRGEVEDEHPPSSTRRPTPTSRPPAVQPPRPTSTQRPQPAANNNNNQFVCRADGMFADPQNCRKFIRCVSAGGVNYSMYKFDCGPGTAFNEQQQYCDHVYNVPNCNKR